MLDHDKVLERLMQAYEQASSARASLQDATDRFDAVRSDPSLAGLEDVMKALKQV